jgi:predicted phosphodiesterase
MTTSGLFTTHRVEIEAEIDKPFKFIPFGDVHRDSDMHAHTHWKEFLAYAKHQKNAVFLGMGDFTDGISTSERVVINGPHLHDTTRNTMQDLYKGVAKTMVNELSFMRGRLIGMLGGNHYFDFGNGDTTDHVIAHALGAKFLGVCSFIRLSINIKGRGSKKVCHLDIFAHHGKGGGSLPGSTFNTIEKMATTAVADFYLMGHDHKKGCVQSSPRLTLANGSRDGKVFIRERTPWLGRTGSFLKAYEPGKCSYNVDAGRNPASLGWIEFEIVPTRICSGGKDLIEFRIRGTS